MKNQASNLADNPHHWVPRLVSLQGKEFDAELKTVPDRIRDQVIDATMREATILRFEERGRPRFARLFLMPLLTLDSGALEARPDWMTLVRASLSKCLITRKGQQVRLLAHLFKTEDVMNWTADRAQRITEQLVGQSSSPDIACVEHSDDGDFRLCFIAGAVIATSEEDAEIRPNGMWPAVSERIGQIMAFNSNPTGIGSVQPKVLVPGLVHEAASQGVNAAIEFLTTVLLSREHEPYAALAWRDGTRLALTVGDQSGRHTFELNRHCIGDDGVRRAIGAIAAGYETEGSRAFFH